MSFAIFESGEDELEADFELAVLLRSLWNKVNAVLALARSPERIAFSSDEKSSLIDEEDDEREEE
jgi:hypothetical protein